MSTLLKGLRLKGVKVEGSVLLSPLDLNAAYWLKRGTLITGSTSVQVWGDSSGNAREFSQSSSGNRPAYNSSNGFVTFDGANDFLRNNTNAPTTAAGEIFMIINWSGTSGTFHSQRIGGAIDADARMLRFFGGANSTLEWVMNEAGSNTSRTANTYPSGTWYILSVTRPTGNRVYLSGLQLAHSNFSSFSWLTLQTPSHIIGGESRNIAGGTETTPINFGKFTLVDCAFFTSVLNDVQRSKLVNYYRYAYSDLNLQ